MCVIFIYLKGRDKQTKTTNLLVHCPEQPQQLGLGQPRPGVWMYYPGVLHRLLGLHLLLPRADISRKPELQAEAGLEPRQLYTGWRYHGDIFTPEPKAGLHLQVFIRK